jgi:fatty-acyl-CoA synthase
LPPEAFRTAAEAVLAREHDSNPGLVFEGRRWTWAEVVDEMVAWTGWLTAEDPDDPTHVGVLLDNVPEYLFTLGAAMLSGSVIVGLNSTRRGEELARDIAFTDCGIVLTDAAHRPLLAGLDLGQARIVDIEHPLPVNPKGTAGQAGPSPDDLALLLFTAGSTGAPKAVRVSQQRVARSATGIGFTPDDVLYCAMPLFHGNALFSSVFPAMGSGASIVLRRRFSASSCMSEIRSTSSTFFATIGRALSFIVSTPSDPHDRHHRLKVVLAPESSMADAAAFEHRFGCRVVSGYGSSENAVVFVPRAGLPPDALGVPLDGLDVAIVNSETEKECDAARFDDSGKMLNAAGAIGEIVGRKALGRFEGYYKNPEADRQRSRNGWYWSGDLGYRDVNGVFYFAGRTMDWIRVDGENFASAPLERLFNRFDGVSGVAVFGVPDERTADDQVMAVLEFRDPATFDPSAFDEFLGAQPDLGTKWTPRYVRLVGRLPVGPTNKTDKQVLRNVGWRAGDRVYWRPARGQPLRAISAEDTDELEEAIALHRPAGRQGRSG